MKCLSLNCQKGCADSRLAQAAKNLKNAVIGFRGPGFEPHVRRPRLFALRHVPTKLFSRAGPP
jgi:hypothetical protein